MPRYFFNVIGDNRFEDLEGTELTNLETAKLEAQKDIDEIIQTDFDLVNGELSKWSIEICDHDGAVLLVVPFSTN